LKEISFNILLWLEEITFSTLFRLYATHCWRRSCRPSAESWTHLEQKLPSREVMTPVTEWLRYQRS
jgi:hypothetical protein